MINFTKTGLNHQKPPIYWKCWKYPHQCMKKAWKHKIKCKRKGKRDLSAFKDKNLAKILEENDKNLMVEPSAKSKREKSWKTFWKSDFEKSNLFFLKKLFHEFRSIKKQPRSIETDRDFIKTIWHNFDRLKISFDRSKQTEALSMKFKNFRSIEKQNGSIKIGRGSPNFEEKTQFLKNI